MSLRGFVETFPPLKIALYINDAVCFIFSKAIDLVYFVIKNSFRLLYFIVAHSFGPIYRCVGYTSSKLADALPPVRKFREERERRKYGRLKEQQRREQLGENGLHDEPLPYYENQLVKRLVTYHGALVLALTMYIFVYFVLIKRHTYVSVLVAVVLLLIYMIIVENSHNIRSILMLCMPIMFTNRGRALIFCSMLALLASGPIQTMHHNVKEIHLSLNCCKQYLIVSTDKYVGDNVVDKLVRLEEVVVNLVNNIKMFANDLKKRFDGIIQLAIETELYVEGSIRKLAQALNYCRNHNVDVHRSCERSVSSISSNCRSILHPFGICDILSRARDICQVRSIKEVVCDLPRHVLEFFTRLVAKKLNEYVDLIAAEFYVDVDVKRSYAYNLTKSKSYSEITKEIKFDVEQKFWYVRIVRQVFNFVSLILVTWIFLTATLYHMHYLRDLHYDNMYLDERLEAAAHPDAIVLTPDHERLYLKPFSVHMNKVEISKLYISGIVWLVVVGYISFFVTLDYALFLLVDFLIETLRDILFTSDLPLIDLTTKAQRGTGGGGGGGVANLTDTVVKYNRTYLSAMRKRIKEHLSSTMMTNNTISNFNATTNPYGDRLYTTNGTIVANQTTKSTSSIQAFYDRLMASLERDIPDDVAILESLEGCLPKTQTPIYDIYKALLYLGLFTFAAVIVEAYALRTRHCIANLYYPRRARRRAKWLYRKIKAEKPKYDEMDESSHSKENSKKTSGRKSLR